MAWQVVVSRRFLVFLLNQVFSFFIFFIFYFFNKKKYQTQNSTNKKSTIKGIGTYYRAQPRKKTRIMDNGVGHDLSQLLSSEERDFLIRKNGDEVKVSSLAGKIVGLYFSASWCGPCRRFTPKLIELYEEVASKGNFEVVFISSDRDDESFKNYLSEMPWLAIPFSDLDTRKRLKELFKVRGIPNLVIFDENGHVSTEKGTRIVTEYGVDAYPFTPERINFLKEQEEAAKQNQTLSSILVSSSRDYLISNDGKQVPVSELEGKLVGLYFSMNSHGGCIEFTPKLVEAYKKLKETGQGQDFEIVLISLDHKDEQFKEGFEKMPWLALPFNDKSIERLVRYFELQNLPTLVIIGPDGKTLNPDVSELIEEHGVGAYPFSPEKLAELAEIEKAKLEAQTLESLLVFEDKDYVIEKNGSKVPVSELVGKTILLYFSAHWCPPCRAFLPKLITTYHDIKAKDKAFEVIFISSDRDQSAFDEFFSSMPWLALPFGDVRKKSLQRTFKVQGIPAAIAIGPSGRTLTSNARKLIGAYGEDAYPFTEEHLKHLEKKVEEMAKGWPEKVKHESHVEHELVLTRRPAYGCNGCREPGYDWSFYCKECDFDLHPKCALKNNEEAKNEPKANDGYVCDGYVCRKA
ncbi:probable nucleoredoxin 1 [Ziziphus jujuba]|uniref:protein-disulfide reductase n=1 Tax=Ziziphus jujuba TaxID=326968 RepID=A0ABM3I845_ZIZJJ|nr:probable nucleoredoxin 1 [Ziziphus jujuba]